MRIVLIHGNDGSDVRVGKTCRSLVRLGHEVHFVGWDRRPGVVKPVELDGVHCHMLNYQTTRGRTCLSGEFRFTWHVLRALRRIRPDTVCAVNEENTLRVLPWRWFFYRTLVCEIYDGLEDRTAVHSPSVRMLLSAATRVARRMANRLIVTDERRFAALGPVNSKAVIVSNFPETRNGLVDAPLPTGPLKLYVTGALNQSRGLAQILWVLDHMEDVRAVSAGWLYDTYAAEKFANHPKVDYRGVLTARKSLELAAQCDAVFAFYSPHTANNRMASPNKVYDAMMVGRPLIINSEAAVSEWVEAEQLGFRCPYDNRHELVEIVRALAGRREFLSAFAARSQRRVSAEFSWEGMEERLREIYGDGFHQGDGVPAEGVSKAA
jgi:glycosyltransferase involved in cell wall biosynthesis